VRSQWQDNAAAAPVAAMEPETAPNGSFADLVQTYEKRLIRDALSAACGNQTKAAELLDMPLRTLVYKLRSYGLRHGAGRASPN
jgi:DNA-binding NtrC family response regulator